MATEIERRVGELLDVGVGRRMVALEAPDVTPEILDALARADELRVVDVPKTTGSYPLELTIEPNWSLDGRFFQVSLVGKLDMQ